MIGRTLGHYRILDRLGTGGMGDVWLAEDTRLRRRVALKMLRRELAESVEKRARFEREAKAVAALSHPAIVTLHAVEEIDGLRFLAMEYLEGRTLDHLIRPGGLPVPEILRIGEAVAGALAAAHARGILHRDLKPSNVMVGDDGRIKVLDFGLAKLLRCDGLLEGEGETALTRDGEVLGTLNYSSPEQLQLRPLDTRSDLYSLGALLFELAIGEVPFRSDSTAQVITEILCDPPRRIEELDRRLPPELAELIASCLDKNPARRPESASAVAARLAAIARRLETGRRAALPARIRRFSRGIGAGPVLAIAALALVVAALPWALRELRTSRRGELPGVVDLAGWPAIAVLPFANPEGAPDYFVEGMSDGILGSLARRGGVRVVSRQSSLRYRGSSKPPDEIARELGVDLVVTGAVERDGELVRLEARLVDPGSGRELWSGRSERPFPAAIELYDEAAAAIAEAAGVKASSSGAPLRRLEPAAYEAYLQARYWAGKFSEEDLLKAKGYFERSIALDSSFAPAWSGLADTLIFIGSFHADSDDPIAHAEAAARRAIELEPGSAEAYAALSDVAMAVWDWAAAERHVRRALELDPNSAQAHRRYWLLLCPQGRLDEARAAIERARRLDPFSVQIASDFGIQLLFENRLDEAESTLLEALELDPDYTLTHAWLWMVYSVLERDPERGRELLAYLELAGFREELDRLAEELDRFGYDEALRRVALRLDERYREDATMVGYIAGLLAEAGESDRALAWLRRGVERRNWSLIWMPVSTDYRKLRGHPEFERLVRKLGVPPGPEVGRTRPTASVRPDSSPVRARRL